MTHKDDDLTTDMEKGSDHSERREQPQDPKDEVPSSRRRNLYILGATLAFLLALLGLAAFTISFPIIRCSDDNNSQVKAPTPGDDDETSDQKVYVSAEDSPFNVTLSLFTADIARGYQDPVEIEDDLENVARFLLNSVLSSNTGGDEKSSENFRQPVFADEGMAEDTSFMGDGGGLGDDFSDYGSNNQEEDVEEGDLIVSDGKRVFAAYGDNILVWDANTGDELAKIEMPPITEDEGERKGNGQKGRPVDTSTFSMIASDIFMEKPRIRHLLLQGDRLLVVVDGYGRSLRSAAGYESPILYDLLSTHVRLYKIVDEQNGDDLLKLVSKDDLNGYFSAVRAIDGNAHLVTSSGIDTYTNLVGPCQYYNFDGMNQEDYIEEVKRLAEEEAIPKFVSRLMKEISHGGMPNLFRISLMQSEVSGSQLEEVVFSDGAINSFVQVHSFNMTSDSTKIEFVKSGAFFPSYGVQVYGAEDTLILSGEGWEFDVELGFSTQSTHLLGVSLNGASSAPSSIGKVAGYILSGHSIDVKDNILRIATTIRDSWRMFFPLMEPAVLMPMDDQVEPAPEEPAVDVDTTNTNDVDEEESTTQNYVITLNLTVSDDGVMEEVGRIKLGKPNEVFTAVRFFDNIAYAVTFERTDPLYVLDLADPSSPSKLSELEISGFSSYLHSINPPENTLLLAIGEEATDEGRVLGMQITVFDMTNFSDPKVAARHVIEDDEHTHSYSDSTWDFMAVRYAAGRLIIPLDIYSWGKRFVDDEEEGEDDIEDENFHGFVVFIANETMVEEECRISHEMPPQQKGVGYCYDCASALPRRSMIFNGDLTTTQNHFVRSTDIGECEQVWEFDLALEDEDGDGSCCFNGYYY